MTNSDPTLADLLRAQELMNQLGSAPEYLVVGAEAAESFGLPGAGHYRLVRSPLGGPRYVRIPDHLIHPEERL